VRKIYYNLTITGLSVAVAFIVGSIELLSIAGVAHVDLSAVGYFIFGLFIVTWAIALVIWRIGRIEEKWAADIGSP
jgi:high-affinity nickel-transport protein